MAMSPPTCRECSGPHPARWCPWRRLYFSEASSRQQIETQMETVHSESVEFWQECVQGLCGGKYIQQGRRVSFHENVEVNAVVLGCVDPQPLCTTASTSSYDSSIGHEPSASVEFSDVPIEVPSLPARRYVLLRNGRGPAREAPFNLSYHKQCDKFLDKWLTLLSNSPLLPANTILFDATWGESERLSFLEEYESLSNEVASASDGDRA
eukprot:TRINITY_DN42976_c0_g1_i1.p1 TRINITY_DN42976_c0_g1~~TRINITY_DN42976_c0_g1_i1.p1  ORF type:complete len:209 (+),score=40.05 TRINITY_DN42976_c0_g1_i1:553-1179(+)